MDIYGHIWTYMDIYLSSQILDIYGYIYFNSQILDVYKYISVYIRIYSYISQFTDFGYILG